jgi:N-acetylmuramoyl-L-alanine amidase
MRRVAGLALLGSLAALPAWANESLRVVYPPANHQTTADRIFLIGTAPPKGEVTVNDGIIGDRSPAGHFAPSFPLKLGENTFTLRYQNQTVNLQVTRVPVGVSPPEGLTFAKDSLSPAVDIAKLPGELICFSAIAPPDATVSVKLAGQTIPLAVQRQTVELPSNSAVLTQTSQPVLNSTLGRHKGCTVASQPGNLGKPEFQLAKNDAITRQVGPASIKVLSPAQLSMAQVMADQGVARTGPSTGYSRLTPLPKGTQAAVTGQEGEWLRLDYGGWINRKEVRILTNAVPPRSLVRGVRARQTPGATEITFPLEVPVPVSISQGDRSLTLTLHNTTAQTDTIFLNNDPVISRLDWQQIAPGQVQYTFNLKSTQQWGYKLNYNDTSLILSLRHPSAPRQKSLPLAGIKILLDPGHGGSELGSVGPTGYPEKDANLVTSKLLQQELVKRGATVLMTRKVDEEVPLANRVAMINQIEPAIALSIHYNALPDNGDALNTQGIGAFWYHTQGHNLAVFLHDYLVKKLNRPSYGVFWNNLALTRPTAAPAVLLELGFMINPTEFEWIVNSQEQKKLAAALADGITQWLTMAMRKD